jgi:exodeoxyribonuclease VII small subunit
MNSTDTDGTPFEDQLEELERIVRRLDDESVGLEESLDLFERGMDLARRCRVRLDTVQERVTQLLEDGSEEDLEVESD